MKALIQVLIAGLAALVPISADAQDVAGDKWEWSAELYFWGASLSGETTGGDDIDIGIDTIVDDLNFGAMGFINGQRGDWSVFADAIYLNLEDQKSTTANIIGVPITVRAKVDLQGVISTAGVGYRVYEAPLASLDALAGGRLLWLDSDLNFDVGPLGAKVSDSETTIDAIVGLRGKTSLSPKWYLSYYGDIGTGQSDLTWQALGSVNYKFERLEVSVGYRYLSWDLDDFGPFDKLDLHGPFAGVRFNL